MADKLKIIQIDMKKKLAIPIATAPNGIPMMDLQPTLESDHPSKNYFLNSMIETQVEDLSTNVQMDRDKTKHPNFLQDDDMSNVSFSTQTRSPNLPNKQLGTQTIQGNPIISCYLEPKDCKSLQEKKVKRRKSMVPLKPIPPMSMTWKRTLKGFYETDLETDTEGVYDCL